MTKRLDERVIDFINALARTSHMYDETIAKNIVQRIRKSYINEFNNLKTFLQI